MGTILRGFITGGLHVFKKEELVFMAVPPTSLMPRLMNRERGTPSYTGLGLCRVESVTGKAVSRWTLCFPYISCTPQLGAAYLVLVFKGK